MRRRFLIVLVLGYQLLSSAPARAEWISLSNALDEPQIKTLAVVPGNGVLLAASLKNVYKTENNGVSWKRIFSVHGNETQVQFIFTHASEPDAIYVGTDKGVQKSSDRGKSWKPFFAGVGTKSNQVFCMESDAENPDFVWIGAGDGLWHMDVKKGVCKKIESLGSVAVQFVAHRQGTILVFADDGIHRSKDGNSWDRVFSKERQEVPGDEGTTLGQFGVEEISSGPYFSNAAFSPGRNQWFAATANGVLGSSGAGSQWDLIKNQAGQLPGRKINSVAASPNTFYVATDRGVFGWDQAHSLFREIYRGLTSNQIYSVVYDDKSDNLFVATEKGILKYFHPELNFAPGGNVEIPAAEQAFDAGKVLAQFKNEPSILEIQNAAVEYAEVHPNKIQGWRRAAALSAFLPTFSMGGYLHDNQNVDIDRGGTNDADKFIKGPNEQNTEYTASLNWNLSELVWNNDQTSIDSRSKLMAELRDDVLNKVTHLYYERRRLQVETTLSSAPDLAARIEREIKLQELTSGIDALTGGYLSRRLAR